MRGCATVRLDGALTTMPSLCWAASGTAATKAALASAAPKRNERDITTPFRCLYVSLPPQRPTPRTGAQPRQRLVADVVVPTGDLDLRTSYGRTLLDRRVRVAADEACDQLDGLESTGVGASMNADMGDCRLQARKNAEPLMRRVILASL